MKADRSDMPDYLRSRKSKSAIPFLAWAIAVLITAKAVSLGGEALVKSMAAKHQSPTPAPIAEIYRPEPQAKRTEQEWRRVVSEKAKADALRQLLSEESAQRQPVMPGTEPVINKGYKSGEAINILSFNETHAPEEPKPKSKGVRVTVVAETKDSTCWLLKEGSVERRNCKFYRGLNR